MPATFNPTILVCPFTVIGANASTGYLLVMQYTGAPTPIPLDATIPDLGYASYAAMIQGLGLASVKTYQDWPYTYVVGAGTNSFTTDALAKAAAQADCDKIVAKRAANAAAKGFDLGNPYVTIGAAVYGPF